ncbi:MAG: ABC transporter substrate-binding protein, partial [Planctomycetes bacterium]|nr:ABC transporter substrate-binding protein [Planctomycetota bacterium]
MRKAMCLAGLFLTAALCLVSVAWAGEGEFRKGGVLNVATIGEPPSLDPTGATVDVTGMISQHYFETLYAFGSGLALKPLLAAGMPEVSADGRSYTIPLRRG